MTSTEVMLLSTFLLCDVAVHDAVWSIVVVYDFDKCGIFLCDIGYDVVQYDLILLQGNCWM